LKDIVFFVLNAVQMKGFIMIIKSVHWKLTHLYV
jgi:hypothetical protein